MGFLYKNDQIDLNKTYSVRAKNQDVHEVLDQLLKEADYTFTIIENNVVITKVQNKTEATAVQQQLTVSGKIVDANGEPLPGVSVFIKNTTQGTITGIEGQYTINIDNPDAILVFSFIGFEGQEISVANRTTINITMIEEVTGLDEVMVVAYGTAKKSSFTGSAVSVKSEDIKRVPVTSFEKALTGLVSGVQISNNSGQPGSGTTVRIRGRGSYSASSSPLYVIDGIPMTTGSMSTGGNLLSSLNPGDIKSLTVLKDAAAASLYGSQAANGVIVITTKQGQGGKTKINASYSVGYSDFATDNLEVASGDAFVRTHTDAMRNAGYSDEEIKEELDYYEYSRPEQGYFDWKKALFRTGVTQNAEVSASGGNEKTTFYLSTNIFDQTGVAYCSELSRNSGRINLTHKYSDNLKFGTNILLSQTDQARVRGGNNYRNPFYGLVRKSWPTVSPYNEDGTYKPELKNGVTYNILDHYEKTSRDAKLYRTMLSGWAELNITKNLTAKTTAMYDWIDCDEKYYASPSSAAGVDEHGEVSQSNSKRINLTSSTTLVYDKTFSEAHHINLLGGYEVSKLETYDMSASGQNLPNETLNTLSVTSVTVDVGGSEAARSMISYLSRLNYDYRDKYYLSGSFRRDGSSKLGINERWANFYSISGSWRISEEGFMQDLEAIDNLKVRASYGTSGNLPSGYYDHLSLFSYSSKYNNQPAAAESQLGNDNLTWEKNKNFNLGLEFGLFERVSASVDYFKRTTSDLLMAMNISTLTGFESIMKNVGEMENSGFEFELNTQNFKRGNFKWSTTFNISFLDNKITKLISEETDEVYIKKEGSPYYTFYLLPWAGVDPENGDALWYLVDTDEDGNKTISTETTNNYRATEQVEMGTPDPDFYGSIGNNFSYKGFDFSFLFNFSVGGQLYHQHGYSLWNDGYKSYKYALPATQTDYWQKPGDIATNPKPIWGSGNHKSYKHSSRFLMDNDYIRLKNITLAYNLPSSLVERIKLSNVRLYAQGTNLLTFCSQDLVDPEQDPSGLIGFEMPNNKTITFGISVGF